MDKKEIISILQEFPISKSCARRISEIERIEGLLKADSLAPNDKKRPECPVKENCTKGGGKMLYPYKTKMTKYLNNWVGVDAYLPWMAYEVLADICEEKAEGRSAS